MITRSLFIATLFSALLAPAQGREFYISAEGRSAASGSIEDPWDLVTAFNHPPVVQPGDVLWLRGGKYTDGTGRALIFSKLTGTPEKPIIVRGYPGERATIDGGLALDGAATWYWGFEITSSDKQREADDDGAMRIREGIICRAPNTKLINLVIHDTSQGMGVWSEAPDTEVYGNLIYYNGYQHKDRGHGHGIYFQNKDGAKLISDNIVFSQFYAGLHGYGTDAAYIRNVTLEGNIVFSNGQLSRRELYVDNLVLWPGNPMENIVVRDNFTYFPPRAAGYSRVGTPDSTIHNNVSVTGNYWIGGFIAVMMSKWRQAEFRNNTVYSDDGHIAWITLPDGQTADSYSWDENRYFGKSFFTIQQKDGDERKAEGNDFNEWRAKTSLDAHSTHQANKPNGVWTFLRPNKFDSDRANIAIYNWNVTPSVNVNLSPLLNTGDTFEIRDAQNYYGDPVVSGAYSGAEISIPMSGLTAAAPNGITPTQPKHTAPEFGAFIAIRTGRAAE